MGRKLCKLVKIILLLKFRNIPPIFLQHFPFPSSGVLQVSSSLDYETERWHNLTVRARDPSTGGYADALVVLQVLDVNDNAPEFDVTFLRTTVSEAAIPGTPIAKVGGWLISLNYWLLV